MILSSDTVRVGIWLAAPALLALGLGGLCVCSNDAAQDVPSADASHDAGADTILADAKDASPEADSAEEPWDPVWHETQPKNWPTIGPDGQPDCGPGCRIALNAQINHGNYYGHAYTSNGVADTGGHKLLYALLGDSETRVLETMDPNTGLTGILEPYVHAGFVIYLDAFPASRREVRVLSLATGETKIAYAYVRKDGEGDVSLTALNSTYAFWIRDGAGYGLMSRHLKTGTMRLVNPTAFGCTRICTTETAVLCPESGYGRMLIIDQESGAVNVLDDGHALQSDGSCSTDRAKFIWVDYRDPPGQTSNFDSSRSGGEIYLMDLSTRKVERLTLDSPASPRGKTWPSVGDTIAVWKEPLSTLDQNPLSAQDLYASAQALVVFDLATRSRCRIELPVVSGFTTSSVHGRHVYGYWGSTTPAGIWLVDIDLDNPAIQCKPY